ncbi:MAG: hypothetical protein ACI82A_002035 [Candidatus Azotimanducaceae bacterium]|jgi:hypothetical protein
MYGFSTQLKLPFDTAVTKVIEARSVKKKKLHVSAELSVPGVESALDVNMDFAITSRACPPFCIQPSELAPAVKLIGELEVLSFLKKNSDGDASMIVIDTRTSA